MSGPGATPAGMVVRGTPPLTPWHAMPECTAGDRRHSWSSAFARTVRVLLSTPPLIAIITILLYGCAPLEPQRPPEVRTQVVEVKVPVPVPCFTEADRPVLAPLTPIDIDRATVDQMAAALAADEANEILYRNAVDALFLQCTRVTGGLK